MEKFKIPTMPKTESKTIRIPIIYIKAIEKAIKGTQCSFSAFVVAAIRRALEELENQDT